MTTTNGTHAHNGAGGHIPNPQSIGQQVEQNVQAVSWLFWTMQVMVEIWGAVFGVLFLFCLAASGDWQTTTAAVSAYILAGVVINTRNKYQPVLPVSPPTRCRRLIQLLGWPLRQAVRDMQENIFTTWDTASGKLPDGADIRFSLAVITGKWLTAWILITVFLPVSIAAILEQVGH